MGGFYNHNWGSNAVDFGDVSDILAAINGRVQFVASKNINVPADAPDIQSALDLAGEFYSKDGVITITVAPGTYDIPGELACHHPNEIFIQAATVTPLTSAGYSGVKATDLATTLAHHPVVFNNTGSASFLGGTKFNRLHFLNIAFIARDTDSYFCFISSQRTVSFTQCTFFGGKLGMSAYYNSHINLRTCTMLHQSNRCVYVWNSCSAYATGCSFIYSLGTGLHSVHGSSLYIVGGEVDSNSVAVYSRYISSVYISGGSFKSAVSIALYALYSSRITAAAQSARLTTVAGTEAARATNGSIIQLLGANPADLNLAGITGAYMMRGLYGSSLFLSAAVSAGKICRLDISSNGRVGGYPGTVSPSVGVSGNNNCFWA